MLLVLLVLLLQLLGHRISVGSGIAERGDDVCVRVRVRVCGNVRRTRLHSRERERERGGGRLFQKAASRCACLLVPQGREHEYVFASDDGLLQIAGSAGCCRLVAVTLNARGGHEFGDAAEAQRELGRTVLELAPPGAAKRPRARSNEREKDTLTGSCLFAGGAAAVHVGGRDRSARRASASRIVLAGTTTLADSDCPKTVGARSVFNDDLNHALAERRAGASRREENPLEGRQVKSRMETVVKDTCVCRLT